LTDRLGANLDGMLAEYAVFNEEAVVLLPSHLSFEEAATLPCAAVTAWVALTGHRRVTAGDTVLTQGSGGVAVFALQFARGLGARVIATTSTAEKGAAQGAGGFRCDQLHRDVRWDAKVRELTDGRGVDCIVEIGGAGDHRNVTEGLTVGGHISLIGASLSSSRTGLDPLLLTGRGITLCSISVGSRADFEAMNRAIALHRLRPVIDRTFPFAEAKAAYRHFEGRGHFGKVVITQAERPVAGSDPPRAQCYGSIYIIDRLPAQGNASTVTHSESHPLSVMRLIGASANQDFRFRHHSL
jgi:NADPH:quinone reductase-like Zn-dependent oxidoreductase